MTELLTRLARTLEGTFRIERELGGGGMSHVFLAEDVALGRRVVIKVLPPEMAAGVNEERFRREIQLAARLQHPHIVPLLSAGSAEDLLYYVMPFVEGESLRVKLVREGELPVAESVRILREVSDALAYAHEQGVVHRDIKPDNVLLSRGHAVVTDFGVARALAKSDVGSGAEGGATSLTSLGMALGTPAYMAPEQATADPHVDHRADLYSLGALAYEMLAGRPPFVGPNPQAVLMAQVAREPENLASLRHTVPPALNALVMRCLEKRPADRFQTASELATSLDAFLTPSSGTLPATAVPVISGGTEAALRKTHPLRVAALFALASLVFLTLAWIFQQRLGLPSWVTPVAGVLLVIGLPVMLLTANRERERLLARTTGQHPAPRGRLSERLLTWRGALAGGAVALGGLAVGTTAFMTLRAMGVGPFATLVTSGRLKQRDPLVLADFRNRTNDSTLGASITEALRIDLARSSVVRLIEPTQVAATLRLMQRDPSIPLAEATAREVAQRVGAKAVVTGEVASVGAGYVLTARVIGAADSVTLAAELESADGAAGIIRAVERLSRRLRERIGESLRTIRESQPLDQVTTTSLPALRAYSEGSRLMTNGQQGAALTQLQQAVVLDSTFGMAWRALGVVLSNTGSDRARMLFALTRAYQLRDHMPPHEAAHAEAFYYTRAANDRAKAIESYERLLAAWPDDGIALNNVSLGYYEDGRFAEAEQAARRAVVLQPENVVYNNNLIASIVAQRRFAAADSAYAQFAMQVPTNAARFRRGAELAREEGNYDRAMLYADSSVGPMGRNVEFPGYLIKAALHRLRGQLASAERTDALAMDWVERRSLALWMQQALNGAYDDAFYRDQPAAAIRRIESMLARHPLDSLAPASRPYGEIITAYVLANRLDRAQALEADLERAVPADVRETDGMLLLGKAQIALARGDAKGALDTFRRAQNRLGCPFCTSFHEARALERLGQLDSAIARYESVASGASMEVDQRDFSLAASLRRLGELYESRGEKQKAIQFYGRFVDLWKDADPELQSVVRDVRRHMADLAGEPNRK